MTFLDRGLCSLLDCLDPPYVGPNSIYCHHMVQELNLLSSKVTLLSVGVQLVVP